MARTIYIYMRFNKQCLNLSTNLLACKKYCIKTSRLFHLLWPQLWRPLLFSTIRYRLESMFFFFWWRLQSQVVSQWNTPTSCILQAICISLSSNKCLPSQYTLFIGVIQMVLFQQMEWTCYDTTFKHPVLKRNMQCPIIGIHKQGCRNLMKLCTHVAHTAWLQN